MNLTTKQRNFLRKNKWVRRDDAQGKECWSRKGKDGYVELLVCNKKTYGIIAFPGAKLAAEHCVSAYYAYHRTFEKFVKDSVFLTPNRTA